MQKVVVRRFEVGPNGTYGKLIAPGLECYTIEPLPPDLVGAGSYRASWTKHPTRLTPSGNKEYGYRIERASKFADPFIRHTDPAPGDIVLCRAILEGMPASSFDAFSALVTQLDKRPFELTIRNGFEP